MNDLLRGGMNVPGEHLRCAVWDPNIYYLPWGSGQSPGADQPPGNNLASRCSISALMIHFLSGASIAIRKATKKKVTTK